MGNILLKYIFALCLTILLIYNLLNFNALNNSKENYDRIESEYQELKRENMLLEKELAKTSSDEYLKEFLIDNFGEGIEIAIPEDNFTQDYGEIYELESDKTNLQRWIEYFGF